MTTSLCFLITYAASIAALCMLLFKEIKPRHIPITICLHLCLEGLILFPTMMLEIGFSLYYAIAVNVAICVVFLVIRPKSSFAELHLSTILPYLFAVVIAVVCGLLQFGTQLTLHYMTSDPAVHFLQTVRIAEGGAPGGQFLSHYLSATIILVAGSLGPCLEAHQAYSLSEIIMFTLNGLMLWALIEQYIEERKANSKLLVSLGMFILAIHAAGYPLSDMLFGFSYLELSVTITICLIALMKESHLRYSRVKVFVLWLPLVGITETYTLFVPAIYVAVFVFYILEKGKTLPQKLAHICVLFSIPFVLSVLMYFAMFGFNPNSSATTSIAMEGYVYRNLFSDFIFLVPFSLVCVYQCIKEKAFRTNPIFLISLAMLCCSVALLVLGILGYVSSYYFFKCHFMLWSFLSYMTFIGLENTLRKDRVVVISYVSVWVVLLCLLATGADARLSNARQLFNPTPATSSIFELYATNKAMIRSDKYNNEKIELYKSLANQNPNESNVTLACDPLDFYWCSAFMRFVPEFNCWQKSSVDLPEIVNKTKYALVLNDKSALGTDDGMDYEEIVSSTAHDWKIILQNDAGTLYENTK